MAVQQGNSSTVREHRVLNLVPGAAQLLPVPQPGVGAARVEFEVDVHALGDGVERADGRVVIDYEDLPTGGGFVSHVPLSMRG